MSPIVVITLILIGIGGAYFLMTGLGDAQIAAGGTVNPTLTNYGSLAGKILIVVMVLYGIYYIVDVVKTTSQRRKEEEKRQSERITKSTAVNDRRR